MIVSSSIKRTVRSRSASPRLSPLWPAATWPHAAPADGGAVSSTPAAAPELNSHLVGTLGGRGLPADSAARAEQSRRSLDTPTCAALGPTPPPRAEQSSPRQSVAVHSECHQQAESGGRARAASESVRASNKSSAGSRLAAR